MNKYKILKYIFFCTCILIFSACSSTVNYSLIVKDKFPNFTPLKRDEFCLQVMKGELPPDELSRVIKHPQYIETDIDFDGKLDFAYLIKKNHSNRISVHLVSCLNKGGNEYDCSIIDQRFSSSPQIYDYLDYLVLTEPNHYCEANFPTDKKLLGLFPTLGCCFTLYYYDNEQHRYKSCDIGD